MSAATKERRDQTAGTGCLVGTGCSVLAVDCGGRRARCLPGMGRPLVARERVQPARRTLFLLPAPRALLQQFWILDSPARKSPLLASLPVPRCCCGPESPAANDASASHGQWHRGPTAALVSPTLHAISPSRRQNQKATRNCTLRSTVRPIVPATATILGYEVAEITHRIRVIPRSNPAVVRSINVTAHEPWRCMSNECPDHYCSSMVASKAVQLAVL